MQSVSQTAAGRHSPENRVLPRYICRTERAPERRHDFKTSRQVFRCRRDAGDRHVPSGVSAQIAGKETRSLGRHENDRRRTPTTALVVFMFAEIAVCLPLSRTFLYELETPAPIGC